MSADTFTAICQQRQAGPGFHPGPHRYSKISLGYRKVYLKINNNKTTTNKISQENQQLLERDATLGACPIYKAGTPMWGLRLPDHGPSRASSQQLTNASYPLPLQKHRNPVKPIFTLTMNSSLMLSMYQMSGMFLLIRKTKTNHSLFPNLT